MASSLPTRLPPVPSIMVYGGRRGRLLHVRIEPQNIIFLHATTKLVARADRSCPVGMACADGSSSCQPTVPLVVLLSLRVDGFLLPLRLRRIACSLRRLMKSTDLPKLQGLPLGTVACACVIRERKRTVRILRLGRSCVYLRRHSHEATLCRRGCAYGAWPSVNA